MTLLTHKIKIDTVKPSPEPLVEAVQCDANTRAVAVTLLANDTPWAPPAGFTASVAFKKPDGMSGWYDTLPNGDPACTVEENTVTAILAPEVLTAAGKGKMAVVFQDENLNQLATFPFWVVISENPAAGGVISNGYYNLQTLGQINAAVEDLQKQFDTIIDDTAVGEKAWSSQRIMEAVSQADSAIVCSARGQAVSVGDASDRPLRGLTLYGRTVQNGTPTPDAPVPLESPSTGGSVNTVVTGKNLAPPVGSVRTVNGYTITPNEDGSVTVSGSALAAVDTVLDMALVNSAYKMPKLKANVTYSLRRWKDGVLTTVPGTKQILADGSAKWGWTTTEAQDREITKLYDQFTPAVGDTSVCGTYAIQLQVGAPGTAYEPYKIAQTLTVSTPGGLNGIPVTSGGNYTDESGQAWICDEVDFARGVYVQRVFTETFDGDEDWRCTADGRGYSGIANRRIKLGTGGGDVAPIMCDALPATTSRLLEGDATKPGIVGRAEGSINIRISESINTQDAIVAFLTDNPITVRYALETPIETPLSADELSAFASLHSHKPNTTVCSDASVEVSYVADTKLYIDNKFNELAAAIVNNT